MQLFPLQLHRFYGCAADKNRLVFPVLAGSYNSIQSLRDLPALFTFKSKIKKEGRAVWEKLIHCTPGFQSIEEFSGFRLHCSIIWCFKKFATFDFLFCLQLQVKQCGMKRTCSSFQVQQYEVQHQCISQHIQWDILEQ